jgi:hypothetical protein
MSQCISFPEDTSVRKFEVNEPYFAARWFLSKLMSQTSAEQIKLEVYLRRMKHQRGICWAYEKYPDEYTVVIDASMGRRDSLRAIAHESVHVMQYATGKMKDLWGQHSGKVLWKNQMMDNIDTGSAYFNSPWEKEAYRRQEPLLQAYLRYRKKLIT